MRDGPAVHERCNAMKLRPLPLAPLAAATLLTALEAPAAEIRGRVIDAEGKGVAEAVVYVVTADPAGEAPATGTAAVMDQVQKEFVPHVLPIVVGTEVRFPNHDQIHHHVYSFSRTKSFELPLYKGEEAAPVLFDRVGAVKVGCNIHDWMSGVILVVPTPYFAVTDASGAYTIAGVPPGTHSLVAWHEASKSGAEAATRTVDVSGGAAEVSFRLEIAARPAASRGLRRYE
jgi:plastocyanin